MFSLWMFSDVNGFLYTAAGIRTCYACGFVASLLFRRSDYDVTGLTLWTVE